MTKKERQELILRLVGKYEIRTQEELISRLAEAGCDATQATVSRDVRELKMVKRHGDENSRYTVPSATVDEIGPKYRNILRDAVISADCSSVFCVLKTYSGMANAAAAAVDGLGFPEILGTIAGDDTIFVMFRNAGDAAAFARKIIALDI
ncbi:MAG: arginine repressor [Clostridia bacterium]|nr:arginine repressor [Clostridia bacterium]MBR5767301.1 arginine repressor [Clostridia bacterium]